MEKLRKLTEQHWNDESWWTYIGAHQKQIAPVNW